MPRCRYTKLVRKDEGDQAARQEKELATVTRKLRFQDVESSGVPSTNRVKERRSARLEQKRQHKPERFRAAARDGA